MDHLLRATARAETRHFWFRGFRYFVTSTPPSRPPAGSPTSGCSIADAEPATTSICSAQFGRAYGFDLTASRPAIRPTTPAAHGWPAPRWRQCRFPTQLLRYRHFLRRPVFPATTPIERAGGRRDVPRRHGPAGSLLVNVAAMEIAARRSLGPQPRSPPLQPQRRCPRSSPAPASRSAASPTPTRCCSRRWRSARAVQRRRGLSGEEEADQEISVPAAPVNCAADRRTAARKPVARVWPTTRSAARCSAWLGNRRKPGTRTCFRPSFRRSRRAPAGLAGTYHALLSIVITLSGRKQDCRRNDHRLRERSRRRRTPRPPRSPARMVTWSCRCVLDLAAQRERERRVPRRAPAAPTRSLDHRHKTPGRSGCTPARSSRRRSRRPRGRPAGRRTARWRVRALSDARSATVA